MGTLVVAAAGLTALGVGVGGSSGPHGPIIEPAPRAITDPAPRPVGAIKLVAYRSCADLLAGLRQHAADNAARLGYGPVYAAGAAEGSMPRAAAGAVPAQGPGAAPAQASAPAHSTTTVHETGADEPDLVKSDGRRIVTVSHGVLRVVDPATRRITGSVRIMSDANGWAPPANLLLSGDRALVILPYDYDYDYDYDDDHVDIAGRPSQPSSRFVLVDVAGAPTVLGTQTVAGSYVDARLVGSTARLVARSQPVIRYPPMPVSPQHLRDVVRRSPLSAWLPGYRITEGGTTVNRAVRCGQVSHPDEYTGTSMLTVYSVDLTRHLGDIEPISLAADSETVYGTTRSLYVASNPRWFYATPAVALPLNAAGTPPNATATPLGSAGTPLPVPKQPPEQTEIHRFDITGAGPPRYVGSGTVPGRLLNQYSLSEYAGYLRVATTSGDMKAGQQSAVYELDADTMVRAGSVGGLGKGQRIYAVRFIGPVGYVVTFRQVDPLYTLDLSNPEHPRVAGELELTGYSAYLSPAGDGRLLGVGQEASAQGRTTGLQVALFDVHDPAHPRRLAQRVENDVHSDAEWDPHAFLYWPATGTAVLPTSSWDGGPYAASALVLHVTGTTISVQGTISHPAQGQQPGISRAMVIGDDLWTLSDAGLQASDLATLATRSWIALA